LSASNRVRRWATNALGAGAAKWAAASLLQI